METPPEAPAPTPAPEAPAPTPAPEAPAPKLTALTWLAALLLVAVAASIAVSVISAASLREAVEANTAAMREIAESRRPPTVLHSYGDECDDRGGDQVYVPFQSLRACDAGSSDSFSIPHDRDWNDEFSEAYNWSPDN